ncbi:MAG: MFS transporter [Gammaproteobacteria bacterium]|nr:MFS transporter [Gammaproteobacteria bacterium]
MYLSRSSAVRYGSCGLLYFAQGIPKGLLNIAMPAWLASKGMSASMIASYLAIIVLPWVFKVATGPLMDRFQFPAMGLRRPWVLGAQLGMTVAMCLLVIIDDPLEQMVMLTFLAATVQLFAATQDVAVDGMAIDLVPEEEYGRVNAFMMFGKAIGWASSAALSGVLLTTVGLGPTAVLGAIVCAIVLLGFFYIREREGERRFPWNEGEHHAAVPAPTSITALSKALNGVLWSRSSLTVFLILFFYGLVNGYGDALMPIAAVKLFGLAVSDWSNLVATMGLIGAFLALGLGPLIDRFGIKKMSIWTIAVVFAHALLLAQTEHLWVDETYVLVMLALWVLLDPMASVCVIAIAMSICTKRVSATQFAVYMSSCNLGVSLGSKLFGEVSETANYPDSYLLLALLLLFTLGVLLLFKKPIHQAPAGAPVDKL